MFLPREYVCSPVHVNPVNLQASVLVVYQEKSDFFAHFKHMGGSQEIDVVNKYQNNTKGNTCTIT